MMKKTLAAAGAALITLAIVAPAEARRYRAVEADQPEWTESEEAAPARRRHRSEEATEASDERPARRSRRVREAYNDDEGSRPSRRRHSVASDEGGAVGPRPSAWCGWYMRTRHGGSAEYNLAANWRNRGSHLSGPQVGAIVVWPHHVGEITGQASDGRWIVLSGNDSGQVKERARSVSGAVFRSL